MRRVLLTGFEPFGGERTNPSARAVAMLSGQEVTGISVKTAILPVVFGKSGKMVAELIQSVQPDAVIGVGQSGGTVAIRVERFALNLDDARRPDNEANAPHDTPICATGPIGYMSTLPVKRIVDELCAAGIPAVLSNSAGTYVCNHVFYSAMHCVAETGLNTIVGFIHVPYLPEQVVAKSATPSMSEHLIARALRVAIESVAEHISS